MEKGGVDRLPLCFPAGVSLVRDCPRRTCRDADVLDEMLDVLGRLRRHTRNDYRGDEVEDRTDRTEGVRLDA